MLCHAQILSLRNLDNGLRRILIRAQIVKSRLEIESKKIWRKSRAASSSRPKLLSRAKSLRLESQENNSRGIFIQAKTISRAKSLSLESQENNSRRIFIQAKMLSRAKNLSLQSLANNSRRIRTKAQVAMSRREFESGRSR